MLDVTNVLEKNHMLIFIPNIVLKLTLFLQIYKRWIELAVINATFSADTFFLMSGMLATYNVLKVLEKSKGKLTVPMFYTQSYVRLTPTYNTYHVNRNCCHTYCIRWKRALQIYRRGWKIFCRTNWWTNILNVNNLVKTEESVTLTSIRYICDKY